MQKPYFSVLKNGFGLLAGKCGKYQLKSNKYFFSACERHAQTKEKKYLLTACLESFESNPILIAK